VAGASGTDRSQSDTAFANGTNLTVDSATNTDVAPDSYSPVAADVGNIIQITTTGGGAAFTTGFYQISSIQSGKWRLDRSPAATSSAGATWAMGGALATFSKLASAMVTSNKAFIKGGTYTTTATNTFGTGQAVVTNSVPPNRLIGYASARGDIAQTAPGTWANNASRPVVTLSTNTGLTGLAISNGGWIVENLSVNCASLGTSKGITLSGNPSVIRNCKVSAFTSRGVELNSQGQAMYDCEVTTGTSAASPAVLVNSGDQAVVRCNVHDNACPAVVSGSSGGGVVAFCLITNNTGASSDGVQDTASGSGHFLVLNNVIYGNGRDGIRKAGRWWGGTEYRGNVIYGNGGYGLNNSDGAGTPALPQYDGNAYKSNTSGPRNNFDDTTTNPVNGASPYTNVLDVTLTADPFTSSGTGDFTLNTTAGGGAACRGAGTPGAMPGVSQVGKLDIGALQHADPASGGVVASRTFLGM
jgi:hypothetical protein